METTLLTVAILLYGKISAHPVPNCSLVHIDQPSHITPSKLTESPPSLVNSSLCSTSLDKFFFSVWPRGEIILRSFFYAWLAKYDDL